MAQSDIYGLLRDVLTANPQLAFGLVVVLSVIVFFMELKFVIRGLKPIVKLIALFNTVAMFLGIYLVSLSTNFVPFAYETMFVSMAAVCFLHYFDMWFPTTLTSVKMSNS